VYHFFLIKHTREKKKTACENLRVQVSNRMSQKKKAESQNEGVRVKNVSNSTTTEEIVGINCDIKE
jgi:ACT domain-containing protein